MKLLFDLFPVILFFATFKYYGSNPEGAAALVGSLLGSAVLDVKQAPILLATIVVIVTTLVIAIILGLMDLVWGALSRLLYS